MIEARNLTKWYGPTLALDNLTLSIPAGQIVGFLGPNGAGKTTTLRILTGFMPPTAGSAAIAGHDVLTDSVAARAAVGYLPENTPLYGDMRVEEYLHYRGKLFNMTRKDRIRRIDQVCDRCGLSHNRRRLVGELSKGNRQRVGLAQALLHEPPVLILDEPTIGLDPNQIGHVRELIRELRGKHTILLSSHILPEIEKTADRVMIVARGKVVADGTPDELRQRSAVGGKVVLEVKAPEAEVTQALHQTGQVKQVETTQRDGWTRALIEPREAAADLRQTAARVAQQKQWPLREVRSEAATLEQFFIQITAAQSSAATQAA
jgi:ABC-2 type transport system ATP-binding protein